MQAHLGRPPSQPHKLLYIIPRNNAKKRSDLQHRGGQSTRDSSNKPLFGLVYLNLPCSVHNNDCYHTISTPLAAPSETPSAGHTHMHMCLTRRSASRGRPQNVFGVSTSPVGGSPNTACVVTRTPRKKPPWPRANPRFGVPNLESLGLLACYGFSDEWQRYIY